MAIDGESSQADDKGHDGEATALDPSHLDPATMLGIHVVTDPDPDAAAQRMAAADDVEVVTDREHAEAAFAARAEAGRTAVVVIGGRERAELEAAAGLGPEQAAGAATEAIAAIRQLADELRRIERIRQRTEDRFTEALNERLSAGSGLALHPDTLRNAGRAVVDVEAEIARLETELGSLDGPLEASEPPEREAGPSDERDSRSRPAKRVAAIIVAVVALGAAAGLAAVGAAPVIAAVVAVVGLIVAVLIGRLGGGRRGAAETPDADVTPAPPRRTPAQEQAHMVARARLETGLERARERRRSAQRHWESLAGPDADAHDIEAVLRLRDPQYVVSGAAARVSPTMRTVNAVHRRALARWRVAWAAVGYGDAPALEQSEAALRGLAARPATDPDAARTRLAAADAWTAAGAAIDRTLVLVEPARWLPVEDLASLMAMLPAGAEVIIVQRD